ncbi:MAG: MarR family winged helix-turn-helix transcriptional regulator, partial [Flavobacteriaceae bacterium]
PSTALGPKMGMEATSLSRILKNMEEQGLIERRPNPLDGRGVLIHLTSFGREKRADTKEAVLRFNEVVKNHVDEEKLSAFFEVTETIGKLITEKSIYNNKTVT